MFSYLIFTVFQTLKRIKDTAACLRIVEVHKEKGLLVPSDFTTQITCIQERKL